MGIWIRSQDKCKMGKYAEFYIVDSYDGDFEIYGCTCSDESNMLGKYDNKEKAVKVLDIIQEHIESNKSEFWNRNYGEEWGGSIVTHSNDVFQMPRDIIVIDDNEVEV